MSVKSFSQNPDTLFCCKTLPRVTQVTQVFEKHKGEGILGVVNLMGDYHYCAMEDLEDADVMTVMQVRHHVSSCCHDTVTSRVAGCLLFLYDMTRKASTRYAIRQQAYTCLMLLRHTLLRLQLHIKMWHSNKPSWELD